MAAETEAEEGRWEGATCEWARRELGTGSGRSSASSQEYWVWRVGRGSCCREVAG